MNKHCLKHGIIDCKECDELFFFNTNSPLITKKIMLKFLQEMKEKFTKSNWQSLLTTHTSQEINKKIKQTEAKIIQLMTDEEKKEYFCDQI